MIKVIMIGLVMVVFAACSKQAINNYKKGIYSTKQGKQIDINKLVKDVEHYPVIFIGDHHNTPKTHKFFEQFLQKLAQSGYNLHLANEWFSPKHNELLKQYTDGKIDSNELKEKREWKKFTKYKWELVQPLYETIKQSNGKLYGINISKKDRAKISLRQFEKMDDTLKLFYDELDLNVSSHKNLIIPYFNHCDKMPKKSDENCQNRMYRVQVAWDTYMANESAKIAKKVLKTKKDKLIIFAGALHVEYGLGIPLRFSRKNNLPFFIISNHKYKDEKNIKLEHNKADAIYIYKKNHTKKL